jgi:hypothetical protein
LKPFEQYIYVDASWQIKKNDHTEFKRWKRIQVSDLEAEIVKPSSNHNCFMSIQRYRDAVSTREQPEDAKAVSIGDAYQNHYCGLYFDFDAKPEDGEDRAFAIARAQTDARKLVSFFLDKFEDINPAHVQIWFSGSKGFHVLVRPEIFGIAPHTHLTTMIKNMAWSLSDLLDLKTLDRTVYTISRLWRIENSVHQSTGLRKIELEGSELTRLSSVQIMSLAKTPRLEGIYDAVEYETVAPITSAVAWWKDWVTYFEWQKEVYTLRPKKRVERPKGEDGLPACIQDICDNGPKDCGKNRNHIAMVLATYWKDMGYDRAACVEEVDNWTVTHFAHRANNELRENVSNGRSAVRSVYADHKYAFTCGAIKACGGPTAKVACSHPNCKWVQNPSDQDPEEIPTLHLSEASQGVYLGKMVRIPVHVSGKADAPFGLPLKGEIRCPTDPKLRCKLCPRSDGINYITPWQFGTDNRTILKLIDVTDNQRKGAIKASQGIPNECYKAKVHYTEHGTLEAVRMVPMVDYSQAYRDDSVKGDEVTARSSQHAVRDGYFIGHGIVPNRKYMIDTHAYEHPKDQHIVHLFDNATPNKNDIEHFRLSDDMKEKLMVFQPRKGQTVEDKFAEIHGDLCANVHSINGVLTMATAMDLAFHSVIGFNLRGSLVEKGWFELLVVGDSGTGKSTLIKRLIEHYRVGEMVASEGAKRTGLVWASVQIGGKWTLIWGKIPQNDRGLLVLDEFAEMEQDEVTKLTQLRSEGKAMGQGVSAEYETWARTRLIFLTNVRDSNDISYYNFGIQAVNSIFKAAADTRRVDIAVAVRKGEVSKKLVHKTYKPGEVAHVYTSDLCHNLILWAWSRNPKHIEFVDDAEDLVFHYSLEIGARYDSDIYLVETNDMRHKISRVACAVAARMFSTDDKGIKVLVKPEHVEFAARLFDRCYGRGNPRSTMRYHVYAQRWQTRNDYSAPRRELFMRQIEDYPDQKQIVWALLDIQDFRKMDLKDQLPMPKEEFELFWTFLIKEKFVGRHNNSFRKSGTFNDFLNAIAYDFKLEDPDNEPPF